ncbi:MAG: FecR domain-containing protein [Neoaquamicrobium sediminum]|uniref:FecR domain-containing protein n=1 Tax=Neoaquamicrobium sediminum TaxID=1849104 RepID=UPI004036898C
MRWVVVALTVVATMAGSGVAEAETVARGSTPAGSVIARKSGEEVRFIDVSNWRSVDVLQDLLAGDVLRTNAIGHLAILFADRTQMRLGRNTTLLVKHIGTSSDSLFGLESGSIWGRAEAGGIGLTIETPAAAAAIRGTDFSLNIDGDRTSLIVLDGSVELYNEFGTVDVGAGEAAVARIGQAPTKLIIVDPDDREQMLYYVTLRGAFTFLPASSLAAGDLRRADARLQAMSPANRTPEDIVTLAETSLAIRGKAAAAAVLEEARSLPLSRKQSARLDLVAAMLAGSARRYDAAAELFARALPALDTQRRSIATYGGYFSRALADPNRIEEPPGGGAGPGGALAEAYAAGFLRDITTAIDVLRRAERFYPDDPALPAARAQFALLVDDRSQIEEAIGRALAIDPDNVHALEARAAFRSGTMGDLEGALSDLEHAIEVAPGVSSLWNLAGLVHNTRGAVREAERALKRAIELDPDDPVHYANLGIIYLDEDRVPEARTMIEKAIAVDPQFSVALVARGRLHLQTGEMDLALRDILAGSTANPAYAQGQLLLASAHYEAGERTPAAQAIRNADRMDPNDPVTASYKAAVAIDDYDADGAIAAAQDTLRRSQLRGGHYAPVSANREAGSLLNSALRLKDLNAWGRFYGDLVFDPFAGATFVDQSIAGSPNPFAAELEPGSEPIEHGVNERGFSSLFQGLMASPEMLTGRSRSANLFRRPFLEGSIGGKYIATEGGDGWATTGELQAYAATPFPWSLYLSGEMQRTDEFRERIRPGSDVPYVGFNLGYENIRGLGYFTARPTPDDRFVAYLDVQRPQSLLSDVVIIQPTPFWDGVTYDRTLDLYSARAGIGWSHSLGYRNALNAALFMTDIDQSSFQQGAFIDASLPFPIIGSLTTSQSVQQHSFIGALNHTVSSGDVTWRYGIEGGTLRQDLLDVTTTVFPPGPPVTTGFVRNLDLRFGRAYADAIVELAPDLKLEAGLFGVFFAGDFRDTRLEPRLGLTWTPFAGHALQVGAIRETNGVNDTTLSPVGISGIQPNQAPLDLGGRADTFAVRWNAEWNSRFFTAIDYQHQELQGLAIRIPGSLSTIDIARGTLDRLSASANLHLGHGFGAFGTVALARSQNLDPTSTGFGGPLPYVSETSARFGVTWVNPANLKISLSTTYVGPRNGNENGVPLDGYWTADAKATWEPFDKRFELELAAYNLFNSQFDVGPSTPGWGRSFVGSLKARF